MSAGGEAGALVGTPVRRKEDARLLTGRGRYVADIRRPGGLEAAFVRSPMAHARILGIDVSAALAVPGVVGVYTASDLSLPPFAAPSDAKVLGSLSEHIRTEVAPYRAEVLAVDKVLRVGEAVAVVVAADRYVAEDAADLVDVDYEPLPVVSDPLEAMADDAPLVHPDAPGNVCARFTLEVGDAEQAFAAADHRLSRRLRTGRSIAVPLETRGIIAEYDEPRGELQVWAAQQRPHMLRTHLVRTLGMAEERIRVVSPDMGGSFGGGIYGEEIVVSALALRLGRPVKWIEDRREHLLTARHARDQIHDVEVAFNDDGEIVALRDRIILDSGAHGSFPVLLTYNALSHLRGQFRIAHLSAEGIGVLTNKTHNTPVRGAGRPEATFVMDRLIDLVSARLGMDPADVRFRNLIPADQMPYHMGMHYQDGAELVYDSGDYPAQLRTALDAIDYQGFRDRQAGLKASGRHVGIGLSSHVEGSGLGPHEGAIVRVDATGHVVVHTGANPHGQSHETTLAQVCADALGVGMDDVTVRSGDTALIAHGEGTFASRTAVTGGSAVHMAAQAVRDRILRIAAKQLEANIDDLSIADGRVRVKGDPDTSLGFPDIYRAATPGPQSDLPEGMEPGLEAQSYFVPPTVTFASGTHAVLVEVDPETGKVEILRYLVVDDCGRMLNPMVVDGQQHGGVAHGIGNTLYEAPTYDEDGQLLTASFMDYLLPTSMEIPNVEVLHATHPSPLNPLGAKGTGEGATSSAPGAIANAIADALRPLEVDITHVPIRPADLLALIGEARAAASERA